MPWVRATRTTPDPSARTPIAMGGRFGPHRTTSSRDHSARTGRPCSAASVGRSARHPGVGLPAERAAVRQRISSRLSRSRPRRVGLEVRGLDPRRAQRQRPVARRARRSAIAGPPSCAGLVASPTRPALRGRSPRWPNPCRRATAPQRVNPPARESSANRPPPAATSGPTRWCTPPSIVARRAAASRSRGTAETDVAAASAAASTMVRQPVQRQRCASSARPTVASSWRSSVHSRMMIPGVQKPHWLAPVAVKAAVHRSRVAGSRPSNVVTSRPPDPRDGRHARDPRRAVDQHRAASALTLGAASVLR